MTSRFVLRANRQDRVEVARLAVGNRDEKNGVWLLQLVGYWTGSPTHVDLGWHHARRWDNRTSPLCGSFHTHPNFAAIPSQTDIRTMQGWADSLGSKMVCVIEGTDGIRSYVFSPNGESYLECRCVVLGANIIVIEPEGDFDVPGLRHRDERSTQKVVGADQ